MAVGRKRTVMFCFAPVFRVKGTVGVITVKRAFAGEIVKAVTVTSEPPLFSTVAVIVASLPTDTDPAEPPAATMLPLGVVPVGVLSEHAVKSRAAAMKVASTAVCESIDFRNFMAFC